MKFEGFNVEIPDPERSIELKPFVDAYRRLKIEGEYEIPSRKTPPPTEIGRFAKTETMAPFRVDEILAAAAPFEDLRDTVHGCAKPISSSTMSPGPHSRWKEFSTARSSNPAPRQTSTSPTQNLRHTTTGSRAVFTGRRSALSAWRTPSSVPT